MPRKWKYTGRVFDWKDFKWIELLADTPIAWGCLNDDTLVDIVPHGDRWAEVEEVTGEESCPGTSD